MQPKPRGVVTQSPAGRKASSLPPPDPAAQAHSLALQEEIRARIIAAGGWISFAEYMEMALYAPGKGYYMAGQQRFGAAGDFITAPELGSVLGRVLARTLAPGLGHDGILEFGGGSGALAAQIHAALPQVPYHLLEPSPDLQAQQRARCPTVQHLREFPSEWQGVFLANEVLDAMSVAVVEKMPDGSLREMGVMADANGFAWAPSPQPLPAPLLQPLRPYLADWPVGYRTEVCPAATAWLQSLAERLQRGRILLIDYGQEAAAYYHPQRYRGSLRAYHRHHLLEEPFYWPGLCDLTADVNFSTLMETAVASGMRIVWYGPLARFLVSHGLPEVYAELQAQAGAEQRLALNNEIKKLTLPQEMGERFQVLILEKGKEA
ncbi:SAM-dependent methyltransferase [Acidithiobacillus sp. AMEEHan]|uniref:class I SAM-dependent methyltransferase n=1 Tax=Acidithiobacillus sp. AMEEHan TaxID=2994951 RepID=UPI0027E48B44|nr:SAM-dependent methyltransferase [Acidithiobacillus sp. AMEEHan]